MLGIYESFQRVFTELYGHFPQSTKIGQSGGIELQLNISKWKITVKHIMIGFHEWWHIFEWTNYTNEILSTIWVNNIWKTSSCNELNTFVPFWDCTMWGSKCKDNKWKCWYIKTNNNWASYGGWYGYFEKNEIRECCNRSVTLNNLWSSRKNVIRLNFTKTLPWVSFILSLP